MALIKCPECGKEISSSAKVCIHCGSKITVCPDCGGVYAQDISVCPKCGCIVKEARSESLNNYLTNSSMDGNSQIIDVWSRRSTANKAALKAIKYCKMALNVLYCLPIFIGVLIFVSWTNKAGFDKLESFKSTFDTIKTLIAFDAILVFLDLSFNTISKEFLRRRLLNWINSEKVDYKSYIAAHANDIAEDDGVVEDFRLFLNAVHIKENPQENTCVLIELAIKAVLGILFCVLYGVALANVAEYFIWKNLELATKLNIGLIVSAVISLILFIGGCFATMYFNEKRYDEWSTKFLEEIGA